MTVVFEADHAHDVSVIENSSKQTFNFHINILQVIGH